MYFTDGETGPQDENSSVDFSLSAEYGKPLKIRNRRQIELPDIMNQRNVLCSNYLVNISNANISYIQETLMEIKIHNLNNVQVAEVITDNIVVCDTQDALDIMADANYNGISKIIIHENQLTPEFFDLKTRLAGEILQKFSTYRVQLAIIGDFAKYESKSFKDFVFESNKTGHILFIDSLATALNKLTKR